MKQKSDDMIWILITIFISATLGSALGPVAEELLGVHRHICECSRCKEIRKREILEVVDSCYAIEGYDYER